MIQLKVLLVDDHDGFRRILASFLKCQSAVGMVIEAKDGNEAIDKAYLLHPDIVLMDVHMPNGNGIEATRAIKSLYPKTMVVMMSMEATEEYARNARLIADGYIPKSSMKTPLLSLIADCRAIEPAMTSAIAA